MGRVVSGLEVLLGGGPRAVGLESGARVGLVAHAASIDSSARHAVRLLHESTAFRLTRLFAPEHGFWGHEQDMEHVLDRIEPSTGLPIKSLYGDAAASLRPGREDLTGLDGVIYDLQDVGSRYYTFVYTLSFLMEAAREAGTRVIVLDRPNPLGGLEVEGPVLDPALASFVGRYPLPVRHGMTTGELARLFNDAFGIGCDLCVVPLEGWERTMDFPGTGLPWVPPSPNMPSPATAGVYPGGCLVEGTNLSEGRGTTTPFELVGAPWLDPFRLAAALTAESLPGALFRPASFRPMFQKHAGQACGGVQILVDDPASFRPFATYLVLLREARRQDPQRFRWREEPYEFESSRLPIDLLLGRTDLRAMLERGAGLDELERTWQGELGAFDDLRRRFLIYA